MMSIHSKFSATALTAAFAAALAFISVHSVAAPIVTAGGTVLAGQGLTTSVSGASVIDFNGGPYPTGVSITAGAGNFVTGSTVNINAAPPGDTSRYLAVGPITGNPVTINFGGAVNYIGFYAGSLDAYNTITFVGSAGTGSFSYTGDQLAALAGIPAGGDQSAGSYFNITETIGSFTQVILNSTQQAFELDNFAFKRITEVPLPGTLALFAVALAAVGFVRYAKSNR